MVLFVLEKFRKLSLSLRLVVNFFSHFWIHGQNCFSSTWSRLTSVISKIFFFCFFFCLSCNNVQWGKMGWCMSRCNRSQHFQLLDQVVDNIGQEIFYFWKWCIFALRASYKKLNPTTCSYEVLLLIKWV